MKQIFLCKDRLIFPWVRPIWVFLPLFILIMLPTWASEILSVSGFGTLGYQADNRSDVATIRDLSQRPKDGYATGPTWRLDSRLGVQIESRPDPRVDLVVQGLAYDHYKANLNNTITLAYAALRPTVNWNIRLGRLGYDAFLMADYRNVGYAYPWVRPPTEFYGWIPIFSVDGADAAYHFSGSDGIWSLKAQGGKSQVWMPINGGIGGGYHFKTDNLATLSASWQSASWRVKGAYSRFTSASDIPLLAPLQAGLAQVASANLPATSAQAADLLQHVSLEGARISYTTLGATYDDNTWLIQAEMGHTTATADIVPQGNMGYASLGRHFGAWMPFFTFSTYRPKSALNDTAYDLGATLNQGLRDPSVYMANSTRIDQHTLSVGVRWDFTPRAAFKVQLDTMRSHAPGCGLRSISPTLRTQDIHLNQLTATVDFIF